MTSQFLVNCLISASIYLLVAYSFSIIYYTTKFFHIVHAGILTIGGYTTYFFFNQLSLPIAVSVFFAIMISVFIGIFIELFIYRFLRSKRISSLLFLITSLGLYIILQNIISILWGDETKTLRYVNVEIGHKIVGAYITDIQLITIFICIFSILLCLFYFKFSRIGKNIRAVASNPDMTVIVGINLNRTILYSFIIGSSIAAITGILVSYDTGLTPTMGFSLLLYGVVAMIIGGIGSTWSLIGGAILLSLLQHLTVIYLDSKWMDSIAYLILIAFLIWRPLGFSGKHLKKIEI